MKTKRMLFRGGLVADERKRQPAAADVLVENGRIAGVEPRIEADANMQVVDCGGKVLLPALFDMHVHLREPGREDEETIKTGTEAALNGGVTGILAMPNTDPAIDTGGMVRFVTNLAREMSRIPVYPAGCISRRREGKELAEIGDMHEKGAVMITDDGSAVADARLLRRAMEYARNFDLIVAEHCQTHELDEGGAINEGDSSYRLGLPGMPAMSEIICIERDLNIAKWTKAKVHIQHVSTAAGLEAVRRFKAEGVCATCEVTPHHLLFTDADITNYDTRYKMNPPLRRPEDREMLIAGLIDGTVDCIATDHAPHTAFEKNQDFVNAPFGITGLDTALLSLYDRFIRTGKFGWNTLVRAFALAPRRILGLESVAIEKGHAAEFVVFDPERKTIVDRKYLKSKSANTPFLGHELAGRIDKVVVNGEIILDRAE